jgi:hypothetical protein
MYQPTWELEYTLEFSMEFVLAASNHRILIPQCHLRSVLSWDIKQHTVVIPYRRFGATYPSHLQDFFTFCKWNQLSAKIVLICLLLFATRFGQLCAHHQEKIPYLCDTWYLSFYMSGTQGGSPAYQSHLYRMTNTRCRIGTVFSPDDGHIVARNM